MNKKSTVKIILLDNKIRNDFKKMIKHFPKLGLQK